MAKFKDTINRIIIELAKADWLSRDDLKQRTGKEIQTIKNYIKKDISDLIDTKDFIELVNRNTGKGKTTIEKYKLKSGLANLLAVFNYFNDKKWQKELMHTDYYKNFIPYIDERAREFFRFTDNDHLFFDNPDAKILRYVCLNFSPSTVDFILKAKVDEKNENLFQRLLAETSPGKLLVMTYGLYVVDALENIIPEEEIIELDSSGLLK
jgi:hypothetical protein